MMSSQLNSDFVRKLIAHASLPEAIEQAHYLLKDSPCHESVTLSNLRLKNLNEKKGKGLIDSEEEECVKNEIRLTLLGALSSFDYFEKEIAHSIEGMKRTQKESLQLLLKHLKRSAEIHNTQKSLARWLIVRIKERLNMVEWVDLEDFFTQYYHEFNEEELTHHTQIRAYTQGILHDSNSSALKLLKSHGDTYQWDKHIPLLHELETHLLIWTTKYETGFLKDEKVCLVYTARKEKAGFPKGVENNISLYLDQLEENH